MDEKEIKIATTSSNLTSSSTVKGSNKCHIGINVLISVENISRNK